MAGSQAFWHHRSPPRPSLGHCHRGLPSHLPKGLPKGSMNSDKQAPTPRKAHREESVSSRLNSSGTNSSQVMLYKANWDTLWNGQEAGSREVVHHPSSRFTLPPKQSKLPRVGGFPGCRRPRCQTGKSLSEVSGSVAALPPMKANEVSEDAALNNPSLTKAQDVAHTLQKARGGRRPPPAILKPPSPPGNPPGPAQTWEGPPRVSQPDLTKLSPQTAFNMRLPTATADPSDHPLPQAHKSHPSLFFPGQDLPSPSWSREHLPNQACSSPARSAPGCRNVCRSPNGSSSLAWSNPFPVSPLRMAHQDLPDLAPTCWDCLFLNHSVSMTDTQKAVHMYQAPGRV